MGRPVFAVAMSIVATIAVSAGIYLVVRANSEINLLRAELNQARLEAGDARANLLITELRLDNAQEYNVLQHELFDSLRDASVLAVKSLADERDREVRREVLTRFMDAVRLAEESSRTYGDTMFESIRTTQEAAMRAWESAGDPPSP